MSTKLHLTKEDYSLQDDDWIAEVLSLQPDRTVRFPRTSTSWDALCVLYLLSHLESHYWITDETHARIAQQAYASNYEGEWKTVQEILEQYPQTPKEFYDIFLKFHTAEEFFGNLVRRSRRLSMAIRSKKRDPHGPVPKPINHSVYRDKGTLRPSHRPVVIAPYKDEKKMDRRRNIGHPLIHEKKEKG